MLKASTISILLSILLACCASAHGVIKDEGFFFNP
jgi:hypothetical protein